MNTKKQTKKLQVKDDDDALRNMLIQIAEHHIKENPEHLDQEQLRQFGLHKGVRTALVHVIRKELNWIKQGCPPYHRAC